MTDYDDMSEPLARLLQERNGGPTTEAGKRLLASNWTSLPMSDDFFDMNEAILAIEAEGREDEFDRGWAKGKAWGEKQERARIAEAVQKAVDVGIYPKASPNGPRTPWQDGWNAAAMAIGEAVDALLEPTDSSDVKISTAGLDWMDHHGRS